MTDLLIKGSKWAGTAIHTRGPSAGLGGIAVTFYVLDRDRNAFDGRWCYHNVTPEGIRESTKDIRGTIDGNHVTWSGEQTAKAEFRDGKLLVQWEVPPYSGEATLVLDKAATGTNQRPPMQKN